MASSMTVVFRRVVLCTPMPTDKASASSLLRCVRSTTFEPLGQLGGTSTTSTASAAVVRSVMHLGLPPLRHSPERLRPATSARQV